MKKLALISILLINGTCLCSQHNSIDPTQNYLMPKKSEELKTELSSATNQKDMEAKNPTAKLENCKTKKCLASENLIDSDTSTAEKKTKTPPRSPLEVKKKELNSEKYNQPQAVRKWPPEGPSESPSLKGK
jgi:hypothetical protein